MEKGCRSLSTAFFLWGLVGRSRAAECERSSGEGPSNRSRPAIVAFNSDEGCLLRRTQAECGPNSGEAFVHGRRAFSTNNEGGASMRHLLHCAAIIFASIYSTASASNASSGEIVSLTHTEIEPALTGKRPLPSSPISTLSSRLPV